MNKIFLPVLLVLTLNFPALFGADAQIETVNTMILQRSFLNETNLMEMRSVTGGLSYETKVRKYLDNEMNPLPGFIFNFLLPSAGSFFIQQDIVGGVIICSSIVGSIGIFVGLDMLSRPLNYPESIAYTIGIPAIIAAFLVNYIVPWVYAGNFNQKLKQGLGLTAEYPQEMPARVYAATRLLPESDVQLLHLDLVSLSF
jgi:hypothetical protein